MLGGVARSVFYDLVDTPAEAANLTARAALMAAIGQRVTEEWWSVSEAAVRLGVEPQLVSDLLAGQITALNIDVLVGMLPGAGLMLDVRRG